MRQRVNFRAVRQRFTHIDAELVTAAFSVNPPRAEVTVRFYPWWEHPAYQEARESATTWGFHDYSKGLRDVTVFAVDPIRCQLSRRALVTDWEFCENHPLTWVYEDESQIFCNSTLDVARLIEAILARGIPYVTDAVLREYLQPPEWPPPFSLGYFPYSLHAVVREELEAAGVRLHLPRSPQPREPLVTFLLDGVDYIVASDFEVDVPEFEHRIEWFNPG